MEAVEDCVVDELKVEVFSGVVIVVVVLFCKIVVFPGVEFAVRAVAVGDVIMVEDIVVAAVVDVVAGAVGAVMVHLQGSKR